MRGSLDGCVVPLNQAKLSTGGAASLEQVRVTEPPSDTSPAGKSVMMVERGASVQKEPHTGRYDTQPSLVIVLGQRRKWRMEKTLLQ